MILHMHSMYYYNITIMANSRHNEILKWYPWQESRLHMRACRHMTVYKSSDHSRMQRAFIIFYGIITKSMHKI